MKRLSSLLLSAALAARARPAQEQAPALLNDQSKVAIGAVPFAGTGQFGFDFPTMGAVAPARIFVWGRPRAFPFPA